MVQFDSIAYMLQGTTKNNIHCLIPYLCCPTHLQLIWKIIIYNLFLKLSPLPIITLKYNHLWFVFNNKTFLFYQILCKILRNNWKMNMWSYITKYINIIHKQSKILPLWPWSLWTCKFLWHSVEKLKCLSEKLCNWKRST